MKRFALYIGIATGLVASCSTKEIDFQTSSQEDVMYYASFEQPDEDGTRVYANEDLLLRWTADDRVSIFNKATYNQEYKFTGETGDNGGTFSKVDDEFATGNAISHIVSVYPYQKSTKISENEILTIELPAEQFFSNNTFGLGANTMVSVTSDNLLQYKNVGGYLMLKLYGDGVSVSSITLKGNDGEKLAGKATVTMPLNGAPSTTMANDATTSITLTCKTPVQLGATAEGSTQFWFVVPPVTFNKGFTVLVNQTPGGIFEKATSKAVVIERNKLAKMSPIEVNSSTPVPEAVDLGLPSGIKWASFNLGASAPEEYGEYYAWGEVEPKSEYSWQTYKWCSGDANTMTKYNNTDYRTTLENEDDVAAFLYGGEWRMPGYDEFQELKDQCAWQYTTLNGHRGYRVTGPNGNSVFFPAAGNSFSSSYAGTWGCYWGSDLGRTSVSNACNFDFTSSFTDLNDDYRYYGRSIRAVCGPRKDTNTPVPEAIDLGLSVKWASFNLGASKPEDNGDYYAWGEIETYYENGFAQEDPQAHWKSGKEAGYDWRWTSYSLYDGSASLSKYCSEDGKTVLELEEDAANSFLKGIWRIPTDTEWNEIRENCTWEWTSENGVNGYRISGNGNSIFLPASGYRDGTTVQSAGTNGLYWSSSLCPNDAFQAWDNYFSSQKISRDDFDRYYGLTIRPVSGEYTFATSLSLSSSSLNLVERETAQLSGILSPETCLEKNIIWTSSNPSVATVSNAGSVSALSEGTTIVHAIWAGDENIKAECVVTVEKNMNIAFEDAEFKMFCVNNYDTNQDGEVSFDEAREITRMDVCTDAISSLVGIEHFVSLESLVCSGSTYDSEFGGSGQLSTIDLSHNTKLNYLDCSGNQLLELDLFENEAISTLNCSGNPLISIDISNCYSLETLYAEDIDRLVVIFVPSSFIESSHPSFHKESTAIYLKKDSSVDEYILDDGFGQEFTFPGDMDYSVNFSGKYSTSSGSSSSYGAFFGLFIYANETGQTIIGEMHSSDKTYKIIQKPVLLHNDAIYYRNNSSSTSANSRIKNPSNCYDITGNQLSIVSRRIVPGNRCKIQYSGEVYSIGDNAFSVTMVGDASNTQAQFCCIWLPYSVKEVGEYSFYYRNGIQTLWQLCGFDRVDKVSSGSFYGLQTHLSEYTFNCKMTEVPYALFGRCIADKIIVPEGVTIIGGSAFGDEHFSVKTIVLPSSLTEIGYNAFGDTKPYVIYAYMTTPPNYSSWRYTDTGGTKLHVPQGCGSNYSQWTNQVGKSWWTVIDDL